MKNNLIKSLILSGCLAMTIVSCERKELPAGGLLLSGRQSPHHASQASLPAPPACAASPYRRKRRYGNEYPNLVRVVPRNSRDSYDYRKLESAVFRVD